LRDAATSVPGVQTAALSAVTPVSGSTWQFGLEAIDGVTIPEAAGGDLNPRTVYVNLVSSDWFTTYGLRLIAGRDIKHSDTAGAPLVAVVNEAFARKFTGGANPVGHRLRQMGFPGSPAIEREIVGYVTDAVYRSLREPVPPTMYLPVPQQQEPPSFISVSVRAAGASPALLTKPLASAFSEVNKDLAITFRPLAEQVNAALTQERLVAMLSGFFGALALLLAGLGLYGVTSYNVSRRRAEIGIRMALGARPSGVVRMVLLRVALLVTVGVIAGGALSLWAAGYFAASLGSMLYGLELRDASTLATAAVVLGMIGACAGMIPAARAARIDPARVLRE
jgi:hypothetical protein